MRRALAVVASLLAALLAWACTGDRAVMSPTFAVCPELLGYFGEPELRALGVWWPAADPDAVAFDVAVQACGQGRLPSAALLAQVPAEAWGEVLDTPVLSARVVLYADADGSGSYTPGVDPYWGRGRSTPLSYVPAAAQGAWPWAGWALPEPLSPVARHNLEPSLNEDVFRPWSPRVELREQGPFSYCVGAMDLRACPRRGDTHVEGERLLWREPEVRAGAPRATSWVEADAAPPSGLEVSYCAESSAVVMAFLERATWRVEGCDCFVDRLQWRWAAAPDRLPDGWPCEGAPLVGLDAGTAAAFGLPTGG